MRNSKIIKVLVGLNLLVVLGWIGITAWNRKQEENQRHAVREHALTAFSDIGVLAKDDGWRLRKIGDRIRAAGDVQEEEIAYCVATFERGPKVDSALNWDTLAIETSAPLSYATKASPAQYEKIEAFAEQLIAKRTKSCQAAALIMLRRCRAPHRQKFYESLLQSQVAGVSGVAQRMIDAEKKESLHAS